MTNRHHNEGESEAKVRAAEFEAHAQQRITAGIEETQIIIEKMAKQFVRRLKLVLLLAALAVCIGVATFLAAQFQFRNVNRQLSLVDQAVKRAEELEKKGVETLALIQSLQDLTKKAAQDVAKLNIEATDKTKELQNWLEMAKGAAVSSQQQANAAANTAKTLSESIAASKAKADEVIKFAEDAKNEVTGRQKQLDRLVSLMKNLATAVANHDSRAIDNILDQLNSEKISP